MGLWPIVFFLLITAVRRAGGHHFFIGVDLPSVADKLLGAILFGLLPVHVAKQLFRFLRIRHYSSADRLFPGPPCSYQVPLAHLQDAEVNHRIRGNIRQPGVNRLAQQPASLRDVSLPPFQDTEADLRFRRCLGVPGADRLPPEQAGFKYVSLPPFQEPEISHRLRRSLRGLVIGAIDETGQEKAGEATCGVKRQYLGCAGRVANGINTVHLSYVREKTGHALIGARQWIPREHIEDPVKSLVMGLPLDLAVPHQGTAGHRHLHRRVRRRRPASTSPAATRSTATAPQLREFFESRGQAYVLRVPSNFTLTLAAGTKLTCAEAVR